VPSQTLRTEMSPVPVSDSLIPYHSLNSMLSPFV
jgi:hypothetical protein